MELDALDSSPSDTSGNASEGRRSGLSTEPPGPAEASTSSMGPPYTQRWKSPPPDDEIVPDSEEDEVEDCLVDDEAFESDVEEEDVDRGDADKEAFGGDY